MPGGGKGSKPGRAYRENRRSPLDEESRHQTAQRVAERYQKGETAREIAADMGASYGFVHGLLVETGVLRSRGRRKGKHYSTTAPRTTEGVEDAYTDRPVVRPDVDAELRTHLFGGDDEVPGSRGSAGDRGSDSSGPS